MVGIPEVDSKSNPVFVIRAFMILFEVRYTGIFPHFSLIFRCYAPTHCPWRIITTNITGALHLAFLLNNPQAESLPQPRKSVDPAANPR
jgi:hypothetical protein